MASDDFEAAVLGFIDDARDEMEISAQFRTEMRTMATNSQASTTTQNAIGKAIADELQMLNRTLVRAATARIPIIVLIIVTSVLCAVIFLLVQALTDRDVEATTSGFKSRRATENYDRTQARKLDREISSFQDGRTILAESARDGKIGASPVLSPGAR